MSMGTQPEVLSEEEESFNERLINACEHGALKALVALLQELVEQVDDEDDLDVEPRDRLLATLFAENDDEDTPIEASLRSGTDGVGVRLYLLECLNRCGPISRFEDELLLSEMARSAHVPRLAVSLRDQIIEYMPKLGALARPYRISSDADDLPELGVSMQHVGAATVSQPYIRLAPAEAPAGAPAGARGSRKRSSTVGGEYDAEYVRMRDWLDAYTDLSHETIGLCVAFAFFKEYQALSRLVDDFGHSYAEQRHRRAQPGYSPKFPNDKPRGVGRALLLTLQLAKDAASLADDDEKSNRSIDAEKHRDLSQRFQLAAAAVLDAIGDDARTCSSATATASAR